MKKMRQHAAVKNISGIVLLLVIFSVIVSAIGYKSFTNALLSQYSSGAFLTAETAAQLIDGDRMYEYKQSGGTTREYLTAWVQIDRLCNSSGSTFIYVIEPDTTDYRHITFIFSTKDHDSTYNLYDFGFVRDTTNDEYKEKYAKLYNKDSTQELVLRTKGYIETDDHITAMVPVKDSWGRVVAILCVQRQMEVLNNLRKEYLSKVALVFAGLALLVIVGQSIFLHHTLLRPLKQISEEATRFAKENAAAEKKLHDKIKNRDEIGRLAVSIDTMEEQVRTYIDNLTEATAERERIGTELRLATGIQQEMLPSVFPAFPDRTEFDIYASMDPAKEVGGDFYDFFLIDDDHLCMVIADVSGKGVPAALFMMASKIILANNAMNGKSPADVLKETNEAICSNNKEEMFVTVWLGILDLRIGLLKAANAGHEYPTLKQPDGSFELIKDKHGLVIGAMDGVKYKEYELQLERGSKLFVYTDGVPEATDTENGMFGTERMLAALNEQADASPKQLLENVRTAVDTFTGDAEQFDDLTMLCIEYKGPSGDGRSADVRELDIEATEENLPLVFGLIEEILEGTDCPAGAVQQICIAAEEIFVNVASYAYAPDTGRVKVRAELAEGAGPLKLTFTDSGIPYDPLAKEDPDVTLSAQERGIGGLGVYMTKKLMDRVSYEYRDGCNVLTMEKDLIRK
ncbi:MAG: SpoIIE family protein phosphatase [Oscillospiraceae bacterium]|nr:SpoIIE family protein phosphatase [Oscillospiraceae bacterium]